MPVDLIILSGVVVVGIGGVELTISDRCFVLFGHVWRR